MRCPQIYIYAFLQGNDSRQEISDNAASLWKRYDTRQDVKFLKQIVADGAPAEKSRGEEKPDVDSGVYFLCHGGASSTTPHVTALVKIIEELIDRRIKVRKINVASCQAAGFSKSSFEGSPLRAFCNLLLKSLEVRDAFGRLQGLMVCGYTVRVTTYDPDATFIKNGTRAAADALKGAIRTATFANSDPYQATHPKGPLPHMASCIETARLERARQLWETPGGARGKFNGKHRGADKWSWNDLFKKDECEEFFLTNREMIDNSLDKVLNDKTPLTASMWQELRKYAQMKIVLTLKDKTFVVGSLSEFTDNPDLAAALHFTEESLGKKAPSVTLKFTL